MLTMRILAVLGTFAAAACASSGATPLPFPTPGGPSSPPASPTVIPEMRPPDGGTSAAALGYAVTSTALSLRGAPYKDGGNDPAGFDCSGFVWYVFTQHGIRMPRTVSEQYRAGIDASLPEPGDLVFFSTTAAGPSHVGILIGGDEFVHAPNSSGEVRVERMSSPYWGSRYVGARRVTP